MEGECSKMVDFSLASFGIGAAKIETILTGSTICSGELLKGTVHIEGGRSKQEVDAIYLHILTSYLKKKKVISYPFAKIQLSSAFTIEPKMKKKIPFELETPVDLPRSTGKHPIYLKSGLEIPLAIDPSDQDRLQVSPPPLIQQLLTHIQEAGFVLYAVHNQFASEARSHPFVQRYEFKPSGRFHGYIDQLYVMFEPSQTDIYVDIEIVRDSRVLYNSFYWTYAQPIDSFMLNDQHLTKDPIMAIKEYLNKE